MCQRHAKVDFRVTSSPPPALYCSPRSRAASPGKVYSSSSFSTMAVAVFISGFLLGFLALALAEGAALLWAVRALRRRGPRPPSPPPEAAAAELSGDRTVTEKQVSLLIFNLCTFFSYRFAYLFLLHCNWKQKWESCRRAHSLCRVETRLCGISQIFVIEFLLVIVNFTLLYLLCVGYSVQFSGNYISSILVLNLCMLSVGY
jgi:hypothetical protein